MSDMWQGDSSLVADRIGDMSRAELRQYIVNLILSDSSVLPPQPPGLAAPVEGRKLAWHFGTEPPGVATAGDMWTYTGPGVFWMFVYDPSEATYKWKFVGGPPLAVASGSVASVLNTLTQVATSGFWYPGALGYAVPRAGDWEICGDVSVDPNGTQTSWYLVPFAAAVPSFSAALNYMESATAGNFTASSVHAVLTGVSSGTTIGLAVTSGAVGTTKYQQSHTLIRPVRVI